MTSSASRQMRSARNALVEALKIGEPYPLIDLPVRADPPVAAFGTTAQILIEDSEPTVAYRLRDQSGQPLPGGANPKTNGTGGEIQVPTPAIAEDVTFTVHAVRASGREAMLSGSGQIRVGLDASLPVAVVPGGAVPIVIDHGATVDVEVAHSQEGVRYRLVSRPSPDAAAPDDAAAMTADIPLSAAAGVGGTGGAIRLTSVPLVDDTVIHVRASKLFGGSNPRPPQAALLKTSLAIFVRPDAGLEVTAKPAVVDHEGESAVQIVRSAPGVSYRLHAKPIRDSEFSRAATPDPAALAISPPAGDVFVLPPPITPAWETPAGFEPLGAPAAGTGGELSLPVPPRKADTIIVVEARKTHGSGAGAFTSAERLRQPAAVLARPDPSPPLRLAARVANGKLTELRVIGGQPGVFYSLGAASPLGEMYVHQTSPDDPALNKGIGALVTMLDFVVAAGVPVGPTSAAPPPIASLEVKPKALPAEISIKARRAMTGLTADLGKADIAVLPEAEVQPATVAAGASVKVTIAQPVAGERYAVVVDGRRVADPVAATAAALSLTTGPLVPGNRVELWALAADLTAPIQVDRFTQLDVAIG
jgi:hypothetical protein